MQGLWAFSEPLLFVNSNKIGNWGPEHSINSGSGGYEVLSVSPKWKLLAKTHEQLDLLCSKSARVQRSWEQGGQQCPRHALDSVAQYAIFAKFWPYYTFCAQAILGQEVKIGLSSMWLIFCKSRLMDTAMSRQPNKRTDNLIPNNKFWSCSDQEYLIALINSFRLWHSLKLILWLKSYSIHLHKRW